MIETLAKTGKKALTATVVGTTIAWTTGVAAFVPMLAGAATLTDGDLIKASGAAVYYYRGTDGKRCPFPNDKIFHSWFSDFKSVKTIMDGELQAIGLCKTPMTYRPGTRLVKITTDPKVYAVEAPNMLRHVADEATAKALFGDNWAKQIDDVGDVFFGNYDASDKQVTVTMPPAGSVFKASDTSKLYYIDKSTAGAYTKREIADLNAFKANGWMEKDIHSVAPSVLAGLTAGAGISAVEKALSMPQWSAAAQLPATPETPVAVAGTLSVSLDASTPATGATLVTGGATATVANAGQLAGKLAVFSFMNGGSAELKVTSLSLKRLGVSADTTLSSVYLYDGANRVSDGASVSSGKITFNSSTGLFTIAGGATKKIWVGANIPGGTSGQTVGVGIVDAASIVTSPSATISGTFPVNGNLSSIAQASLATVNFGAVTPAASNIDPQNDYVMWQSTATIGTRAVNFGCATFREVGSGDYKDIQNFRLLVDGAQVGTPVMNVNSDGYVVFSVSPAKKLETGGRVIKVLADIIGGTNRTFSLSLRDVADSCFSDVDYNANVTPNVGGAAFSARTSGDQTVNAGTLTITKTTDSPSGNVVLTGTNVLLGKYTLAATGEAMKIESLFVRAIRNGGAGAATIVLRNGALYANGVQIGSTTALATVAAGTQYSLGSSLVVEPGKPVTLEVKADIFNNDSTGTALAAGDTLQASIVGTANNVQRTKTLNYGTFPGVGADLNANVLTIASGSLTLTKDQAYGNQNVVVPKQQVLLGQWSLTNAGSVEDVNLNTLQVDLTFADEFAAADLTNVYVKYGTKTGSTKATISATAGANTWSINETLAKGSSMMVQVYGDLAAGAVVTETAADTVIPSLLVGGTTALSSTAVNTNSNAVLAGQTTTARTAGVLTVSVDSSSPVAAQSISGTTSDGALKLKLSGTREDLFVKDLTFRADTIGHEVAISAMSLWQSSAVNGPWTQVGEAKSYELATGNTPGKSRWTLSGDGRVKVAKDATVYLLVKPTYVNSQQTPTTANWMPYIFLSDLQAEGSTGVLAANGTDTTLVNSTGIVIQANTSASYVNSTETKGTLEVTASSSTLPTANGITFSPGDVIFVDANADASWDMATEELMVVLYDGGANLTVQRGAFGTTGVAYDNAGDNIYRLSNTVALQTYGGIVGSVQTVTPNKLTLGISSTGYVHGTAQKVASLVATAGTNASDPGQNNITLTYVDLTVSKSTASINNVILYPSQFDLNSSYDTTCIALSQTKWRCTLDTTGSANVVTEGSANTYYVYADVGYSNTGGSIEFSIANLGTGAGADVSWSAANGDATTVALTWVNQGVTQIKAGAQSTTAAVTDSDTTIPVLSTVTVANVAAAGSIAPTDTVTLTFSERIDPTSINASLVPSTATSTVTGVAAASTGGVTVVGATGIVTVTNIVAFDSGDSIAANQNFTTDLALNTAGTILTVTLNSGTARVVTGGAAISATSTASTVKDVNNNALGAAAVATFTGTW